MSRLFDAADYELTTTLNYYRQSGGTMGTTFCNIHIYNPEKAEYKLKKGYSKYSLADGWETILEDESKFDFKALLKTAKAISKEISQPVLSVTYFDDDSFELQLIIEGSRKAYYLINESGIFKKNIPVLIKTMELEDKTAKALRYVISKDISAAEAIDRFSALLQLPLYLEKNLLDYNNGEVTIPDREQAIKELAEEKKAEKAAFGKKKDAMLIQELEGVPYFYVDMLNGMISLIQPEDDGTVVLGKYFCYQLENEGGEPQFKYKHELKFDLEAMSDMDDKIGISYCQKDQFWDERIVINDKSDVIDIIAEGSANCERFREKILLPDDKKILPEHIIYSVGDALRVATDSGFTTFDVRSTNHVTVKSNYYTKIFDNNIIHPNHHDLTSAGKLYFDHISQLYAEDGMIVKIGEYTEYHNGEKERNVRVDFLDYDYNLLSTEYVPVDFDFYRVFGSYCYIKEKRQIVVGGYCVDLEKKTVTAIETLNQKLKDKASSSIRLKGEDGKDYIAVITSKHIYILDLNLKTVSYTNLSGSVMGFWLDEKGHIYLVTTQNTWKYPFKYSNDSKVRLYKLGL